MGTFRRGLRAGILPLRPVLGLAGLAVCCGLGGCGIIKITLQADERTNQGRPIEIVVRSVDEPTYRADSYSVVSRLVTAPDNSVIRRLAIFPEPGLRRSFRIKPPPGRPVALYALYTARTGTWKMLLLPPLPYSVTVPLHRSGIAFEEIVERRFQSPDSVPVSPPSIPSPSPKSSAPPASPGG